MKKFLLYIVSLLLFITATGLASAQSIPNVVNRVLSKKIPSGLNKSTQNRDVTPIQWDTLASSFKGEAGRTYTFRCPARGTEGTVYGSDIYTDDSSICTAAVHAGLITFDSGGQVTIEIRPGRSTYGSTTRHGIKSNNYGQWGRSFVFRFSDTTPDTRNSRTESDNEGGEDVTAIQWDTTASGFKGETGRTYTFRCPEEGTEGTVYGNDIYTDDSSICTAAVHAGLINIGRGGRVTIEFRPGRSIYGSTTRNGIKSNSYGQWGRSFVIIPSETARNNRNQDRHNSPPASDNEDSGDVTPIQWDTSAAGFKGEEGRTYTFRCPEGGTAGTVYGSDVYTDDSSICTAAVHAGLISLASGGKVTIEIRPGRATYGSTNRHGIKSNNYGQWGRSFVVR